MANDLQSTALPIDWERTTLGEIVRRAGGRIQTGPFGSQLHASDYVDVGIPSIMPVNIGDGRIVANGIARISKDDAERLSRHRVAAGDIVYSRRGDVERHALIEPEQAGWLCGTGCIKVNLGRGVVVPRFASFVLRHPFTREWITRHAVGATMPNLNTSIVSEIPFILPPLETQRRIAHILGTLDDKIELNRRMNRTLEGMAAAIFKSWFIDFDPVRAKAEGRAPALPKHLADLFPNTFQDSPLGPIPEGWEAGTLGDVSENPRRSIKPEEVPPATPYIGLQDMPRRCIALDTWGRADEVGSQKSRFNTGEILFGKLRPYFHKVGIAPVDGVCSTDILVIVPKSEHWRSYVLSLVSSKEFVDYTDSHSAGTKMPRTNWKDMSRYPLAIPPVDVVQAFQELVGDFHRRIPLNVCQNRRLAALRDTLLPKLLSGEIDESVLEQIEVP
ncbi:MAG: specificity protein S [Gemmatales bacterium]|nr:MAG: specificity protein S [Gemmatales bacterium]GIW97203.1 MAG: specificity protein S [Pirellulaceae bacterium]